MLLACAFQTGRQIINIMWQVVIRAVKKSKADKSVESDEVAALDKMPREGAFQEVTFSKELNAVRWEAMLLPGKGWFTRSEQQMRRAPGRKGKAPAPEQKERERWGKGEEKNVATEDCDFCPGWDGETVRL